MHVSCSYISIRTMEQYDTISFKLFIMVPLISVTFMPTYIRTKAGHRYHIGPNYVEENDQRGRSSYTTPDARVDFERRYTSTVTGKKDWYLGLIHWLANPTEFNCFQTILRNEQFLKSTLWHNTNILTSVSNIPYSLPRLFLGPNIDTVS